MIDLITIDKSWIDILLSVPALPGHDEKVLAQLLGKFPGGMGGNVACAASRLGLRTGMVSWVGADPDGGLVLEDLHRFGVDTAHVRVQPETPTNYTTVLLDPSGEKAIIIVPTSFDVLSFSGALTAYLSRARLVYCAAFDVNQFGRVARLVRAAGNLVCTDIEPVAGLPKEALAEILSLADIVFVDAGVLSAAEAEQAVREYRARGPRLVVMGLGAGGALAGDHAGVVSCPAFPAPVIDTTGAGDCLAAACLTAFLKGYPTPAMLRYGCAAAALSIQGRGARGNLPTDDDVQRLLTQESDRIGGFGHEDENGVRKLAL